jgi:hypothetical protein
MSFSWTRVGAILLKELRDYRRNRFVIGTMAMDAGALHHPADDPADRSQRDGEGPQRSRRALALYMLVIP